MPHQFRALPLAMTHRQRGLLALALVICVVITWAVATASGRWAERESLNELGDRATAAAGLNVALVRNSLEKYRSLPLVLAQDDDLTAVLKNEDPIRIIRLDEKLESLATAIEASAVYLLDREGRAIAASNWREPATFVGIDYRFRPYFRQAFDLGTAEHFALGTRSHRAGLYLSRRVHDEVTGEAIGVVVVKVDFSSLEDDWRRAGVPVFVTDERGIVLITSEREWRFDVLRPLPADVATALRESLQFGNAAFNPLPLRPSRELSTESLSVVNVTLPERKQNADYVLATQAIDSQPGWSLHLLSPARDVMNRASNGAELVATAVMVLLLTVSGLIAWRMWQGRQRSREQAAIRESLAAQVAARTRDLSLANERLTAEVDERRRAEERLHRTQEELVQASRLALLGQVTAGVAHEINQPIAAIRTFADNAAVLLTRGQPDIARENLATIASLTDRVGAITGELRDFSRKQSVGRPLTMMPLRDAVDGAMLLVNTHRQRHAISIDVQDIVPSMQVYAERIRLEQILINLLQNAVEALVDRVDPHIWLRIAYDDRQVVVTVSDNGPGLHPDVVDLLFTPFTTSKPQGLGLGLVISRDLAREFGGDLVGGNAAPDEGQSSIPLVPRDATGAVFTLTLRRMPASET
ncbi:sensor histidine kinase [Schauerella aestuarii]|uniref:sensor histidine kinase n=1 Tax=Schauerella aestuarii TaxID=2511204 RepID=UPI00136A4C78|nr:ATP-binding protein [Achromobacter aestuarii]